MMKVLPFYTLETPAIYCDRHVWILARFHPLSGTTTHRCRRCGHEKTDRAIHMLHSRLDLYSRWQA